MENHSHWYQALLAFCELLVIKRSDYNIFKIVGCRHYVELCNKNYIWLYVHLALFWHDLMDFNMQRQSLWILERSAVQGRGITEVSKRSVLGLCLVLICFSTVILWTNSVITFVFLIFFSSKFSRLILFTFNFLVTSFVVIMMWPIMHGTLWLSFSLRWIRDYRCGASILIS